MLGQLVGRVKLMLSDPRAYWEDVATESGELRELLLKRVLVLAAIPALALGLGGVIGNLGAIQAGVPLIAGAAFTAEVHYVVNVLVWIGLAQLIEALAERFDSRRSRGDALRLAFGTLFPMWLAGGASLLPFGLLPPLANLLAFGYGAYLLSVGLQVSSQTPREKAVPYAAAVMLIGVVTAFTVFGLVGCLRGCAGLPALQG